MKEERFSCGTPSKNKISNFGVISPLYPNFIYHSLSLSIWRKTKEQKRRKTVMSMDCSIHYIYLTPWKCIALYSKGLMYFYVTTRSRCSLQLCYEFVVSHFLFSFYSTYVILLRIVLLIPLKYHTGSRSCRLLQYNIITTKTYRSISSVVWVSVWIVWNLEPLASGGQSSPKLIPHVICQVLYAWE